MLMLTYHDIMHLIAIALSRFIIQVHASYLSYSEMVSTICNSDNIRSINTQHKLPTIYS